MKFFHPFEPVIFENSKILILGSFPSIKSFEESFYYAHPRNQFWAILSDIFNLPTDTKEQKIQLLKKSRLALWDVIKSCQRVNSSDTNLKECEPNDFYKLLKKYPNIKMIFFTGKKAQSLFKRYFKDISLPTKLLPSPSPAYAAMKKEKKREIYERMFKEWL